MNIKTKFQIGDLVGSENQEYMGKITGMKVTVNNEKKVDGTTAVNSLIVYTIHGNRVSYDLKESALIKLEPAK